MGIIVTNLMKDKKLLKLLAFIVAATESAATFGFAPEKEVLEIATAKPNFLVVDAATKDANGNIKVSSTADAKAALEASAAPAAPKAPAVPLQITIEKGIPVPEGKRGPTRVEVYPFSQMEVGDSFFIAATAERPDPAKALSSTVGSATKRFNVGVVDANGAPVMEAAKTRNGEAGKQRQKMQQTRKFVIRPVATPAGARIFRTL